MCDLETVIINLKACLVSTKGGLPLSQIENDYFKLNGERIPYRKLGFLSLEALLNSSGKFTIVNRGGVSVVQALATDKTQHLTDLIKKQKTKPPKKVSHNKTAPRKFNTSNNYIRSNFFRPGNNNGSSYRPTLRNNEGANHIYNLRKSLSYNYSRPNQYNNHQPKTYDQNNYNKEPQPLTNNYYNNTNNDGPNAEVCLPKTKTLLQSNLLNEMNKDDVKSVPFKSVSKDKDTYPFNGHSDTSLEQKLSLTGSCSSIESAYSSSSVSYTPKSTSLNSQDKFQIGKYVQSNIASQIVNKNDKDKILKNNICVQGKSSELKSPVHYQPMSVPKSSSTFMMSIKPSTAQSRLQKYPKKCDEPFKKVDSKERKSQTEDPFSAQFSDLKIESPYSEVIDDKNYIDELESYIKNLNLSEPYYECMVKKEKTGKTIKHIHICTIKVNEKSVSSSFPVECSTVDYAKQVAAKHALTVLNKQYGENVVYPITNDINTISSRIKEFLKMEYKETGLMSDVLERMYREQFQENLPNNWVQLLEVYSYFTFDKIVANKIIIYLNENENSLHNGISNGCLEASVEEENVPCAPLMFKDYEEKSVLVSANYGSANIWIRFVGQNADENFIQMQAKFNDTMNNTVIRDAEDLTVGAFCAVRFSLSWHRAQVNGLPDESGNVPCFLVDTGEEIHISSDQICYLEPMFMKAKAQAIECVLTYFGNFGSSVGLKELLDEIILNKTFFLVPDSLEDGYARVTLYEKGDLSDRVNVNEKIVQRFLEKTVTRLPSFEENAVVDGIVSSIESGHLYLQLNCDVVALLEEILPSDECLVPEFFLRSKEDIDRDQVYLMKYEDMWCRVQVHEIISDSEVTVIYIDYGNTATCEITQLVNLYLYDPLMVKIPPQAIKVSMNLIPPSILTTDIAAKIYEITGNDKVLVNLINAPTNDVPCIQLYKTQPDTPDIPLCINIQLAQSLKKQITTI